MRGLWLDQPRPRTELEPPTLFQAPPASYTPTVSCTAFPVADGVQLPYMGPPIMFLPYIWYPEVNVQQTTPMLAVEVEGTTGDESDGDRTDVVTQDIEYSCPATQPSLRQGLPHTAGHTHFPCRLFHGFLDTKPYSRHGPARPIRPARTPCNHPTSAAEKPTQPAIHRTASPLWMTTHPSITMPRVRAHQPSDRGTPSIPAPGPTITIRPARPSGSVGPAVWHPFCI